MFIIIILSVSLFLCDFVACELSAGVLRFFLEGRPPELDP
eukprot:SAG11_NODE_40144_length_209_cov_33.690909_1_plen_39_part_10